MYAFRQVKRILWEIIFPGDGHCLFCHRLLLFERGPLCYGCMERVPWVGENTCKCCGKEDTKGEGGLCLDCTWNAHFFEQGISLFVYRAGGKKIIHEIKYQGNRKVAQWVGRKMARRVKTMAWWESIDFVIPVPLHPKRLEERGFNQSHELAKGMMREWEIPLLDQVLIRKKNTPHQTNLNKWERQRNIKNAFQVKDGKGVHGKTLLVVDDVYTTGATMDACARVLKEAGAHRVYFAVGAIGRDR